MRNDLQNFSTTLQQWRTIVVVVKGSPDPDALAAAFAVRLFAETLGVKVRIIAPERLSLPQNRNFVRLLGIPLKLHADPAGWRRKADAYGVVDHQSAAVTGLEGMPCVFHLDHHQPLGDKDGIMPAFRLVEQTAGATCTILARLFSGLRTPLEPDRMRRIATALLFGILTDTDNLAHGGQADLDAIHYLTAFADQAIIRKLLGAAVSERTMDLYRQAREHGERYKDWLFTGAGTIDAGERDSLALVADMLLKEEHPELVAVYALVRSANGKSITLDASLRCHDPRLNMDRLIKNITANGGARHHKGAFQVPLDYFLAAAEPERLWQLVSAATIAQLKKQRDALPSLKVRAFVSRILDRTKGMFRGKT